MIAPAAEPVPAVAETEASGDIAILFEDIRQTLGVPVVNLIFRHLATIPDALPWSWQALKPLYVTGVIDSQADSLRESLALPAIAAISEESLIDAGLLANDIKTIRMILRSYERSNAMNLIAFGALLAKLNGHLTKDPIDSTACAAARLVEGEMPAPLTLAEMDGQTRALVLHLASLGGADAIMPTMYRHLAYWPAYLSLISERLTSMDKQQVLESAVKTVLQDGEARSMRVSDGLGLPEIDLDPASRAALVQAIEIFIQSPIAKMIVVVGVIKEGMPAYD